MANEAEVLFKQIQHIISEVAIDFAETEAIEKHPQSLVEYLEMISKEATAKIMEKVKK